MQTPFNTNAELCSALRVKNSSWATTTPPFYASLVVTHRGAAATAERERERAVYQVAPTPNANLIELNCACKTCYLCQCVCV